MSTDTPLTSPAPVCTQCNLSSGTLLGHFLPHQCNYKLLLLALPACTSYQVNQDAMFTQLVYFSGPPKAVTISLLNRQSSVTDLLSHP